MAGMAASGRHVEAMTGEEIEHPAGSVAVADRTGEADVAGSGTLLGDQERAIVLCRGTKTWRASSDGAALRRASDGR